MTVITEQPLRILHAVRAPVGGIFRHILDLANAQADRGHYVGIVADSLTGGQRAEAALNEIAPRLKLGVHRTAIHREPFPTDILVWLRFMRLIRKLKPQVLHGHGAKAGAFVRLKPRSRETIRVYTPHGGSLHYPLNTLKGAVYSRLERALMDSTDLLLFESAFARDTYQRTIGTPGGLVRCVFNGVTAGEFDPIAEAADATDLVYVGEFRHIKGADILIDAVALLRAGGRPVTLTLAGDGEELEALKAQIAELRAKKAAAAPGTPKTQLQERIEKVSGEISANRADEIQKRQTLKSAVTKQRDQIQSTAEAKEAEIGEKAEETVKKIDNHWNKQYLGKKEALNKTRESRLGYLEQKLEQGRADIAAMPAT